MHEPLRLWGQKNQAAIFAQDRPAMTDIAHEFAGYVSGLLQQRCANAALDGQDVTASLASQQVKG